jgi:methylase of polypeptide subunit release factors
MGMTGSSLTLAFATIRRWFRSVLDLGTGCGIQALLAAGHAERVLATDRSARSVAFARFAARLNRRANIEFRTGDAFRPARGRQFDLIVCNPPFMISPGLRYMYRDSGLEGDGFCRRLAERAPGYLAEGGYFQMTCEWIHPENADWRERLARWFAGSGCDALVLRAETQSPAAYADQWIRDTEQDDPKVGARLYEEYLDYYRSLGIQAISTGMIAMRRRSTAANRIRFEDAPPQQPEPFGESIARAFDHGDALELLADDRLLLAQRLRLSPDARLEQRLECENGAWRVAGARLVLARGIRFFGNVDDHASRLVARCTGSTQLVGIVSDLAGELGVSFEAVATPTLALARQLIERGFLIPEGME